MTVRTPADRFMRPTPGVSMAFTVAETSPYRLDLMAISVDCDVLLSPLIPPLFPPPLLPVDEVVPLTVFDVNPACESMNNTGKFRVSR